MTRIKLARLHVHFKFLNLWNSYIRSKDKISCLYLCHNLHILLLCNFKFINLNTFILLCNKDLRLLFRSLCFFLSLIIKTRILIVKDNLKINFKFFNILRSPFVYNKSKEHFSSIDFKYLLKFCYITNLFSYIYFWQLQVYLIKYNLMKSIKQLF